MSMFKVETVLKIVLSCVIVLILNEINIKIAVEQKLFWRKNATSVFEYSLKEKSLVFRLHDDAFHA